MLPRLLLCFLLILLLASQAAAQALRAPLSIELSRNGQMLGAFPVELTADRFSIPAATAKALPDWLLDRHWPLLILPHCNARIPAGCPPAQAEPHGILDPFSWTIVLHIERGGQDLSSDPAVNQIKAEPVLSMPLEPKSAPDDDQPAGEWDMSWVDLRFGGRAVHGGIAQFNKRQIRFLDPESLVQDLPGIDDRQRLARMLTSPIVYQQQCEDSRCLALSGDEIVWVFSPREFRAELYLGRQWYQLVPEHSRDYLQPPSPGAGLTLSFDASFAGRSETDSRYSLGTQALLGIGKTYMDALWYESSEGNDRLERLAWNHQGRRWFRSAGLQRSGGGGLDQSVDFWGVSIIHNDKLKRRFGEAHSTAVEVFLPRRATVDIYRDGRLLRTQRLDAGNQRLDTARLPAGVYPITIVIRDGDTELQRTERVFVKSDRLPRPGIWRQQFYGGVLTESGERSGIPSASDDAFMRYQLDRRLGKYSGYSLGLTHNADGNALSLSALALTRYAFIEAGMVLRDDRDWGSYLNWHYSRDGWAHGLNIRWIEGSTNAIDSSYRLSDSERRLDWSSSRYLRDWNWGLRVSYIDQVLQAAEPVWSLFPSAGGSIGWARSSLNWQLSGLISEEDRGIALSISVGTYNGPWRGSAVYRVNGDIRSDDWREELSGRASRLWRGARGSGYTGLVASTGNDGQHRLGFDGRWLGNMGEADIDLEYLQNDGAEDWVWSGNLRSALTVNRGGVVVSQANRAGAGLVVDLSDSDTQASLNLYINGQRHAGLITGKRYAFSLSPYRQYTVQLGNDEKQSWLYFDKNKRLITIYPGNVVEEAWTIRAVMPVFLRVLDEAGDPLMDHLLATEVNSSYTDADGYIVVEAPKSGGPLVSETLGCAVSIPALHKYQDIAVFDELQCVAQ